MLAHIGLVRRKSYFCRSTILAASLYVGVAGAQAQPPDAQPSPPAPKPADDQSQPQSTQGNEIIITALRREQALQHVPMSVSALTEELLHRRQVQDLGDFLNSVPGVSYIDTGGLGVRGERTVHIRGISGGGNGILSFGTVGFYIDETPVPTVDPDIFDIARIEILKGPQSTLYGAGSVGGTIRYITNQPKMNVVEGKADLSLHSFTYSDHIGYSAKGALNIPLVDDHVALRVTGWYRRQAGYIDNYVLGDATPPNKVRKDWNDVIVYGGRVALRWEPTSRLTITPSADYQQGKDNGTFFIDLRLPKLRSRWQVPDAGQSERTQLYSLNISYDLDWANLISSTSYFSKRIVSIEDFSGSDGGIPEGGYPDDPAYLPRGRMFVYPKHFTQELRLASKGKHMLDWTLGAFYNHVNSKFDFLQDQAGLYPPDTLILHSGGTTLTDNYALFGEASLHLGDKLTLTGGLRYFSIKVRNTNGFALGVFGEPPGTTEPDLASNEHGVRPKASISYEPTSDITLYATASQGYRQGAAISPLPEDLCGAAFRAIGYDKIPTQYKSDSVWNYEVGAKTRWFNRRLTLNGAAFYLDWSNIQQTGSIGGGCPFQITLNSGQAVSKGFELDAAFALTQELNFTFATGYNDARITKKPAAGLAQVGDPLLSVPAWNMYASAEWTHPLSERLKLLTRADYTFVDDRTITFSRTALVRHLPSYKLVGFRLGLLRDRSELSFFVKNIFNGEGQIRASGTPAFLPDHITVLVYDLVQPRMFGLNFRTDF